MKFIGLLFVSFFLIGSAYSQNINPYLNRKIIDKNDQYVWQFSALANSSFSSNQQNSNYQNKFLPDNLSKNYNNRNSNIGIDGQAYIKAGYQIKEQNMVGLSAKFEINYNSNLRHQNPQLDQLFIYQENLWGKFEFGNYVAVNQRMKYGPSKFAVSAGGINGKYLELVNLAMLKNNNPLCSDDANVISCKNLRNPQFILLPQSPIGHGGYAKSFYGRDVDNNFNGKNIKSFNKYNYRSIKDDSFEGLEDALKFNYYSPRINDVQLGISYTPDSSLNGFTAKSAYDSNDVRLKNIVSMGANYFRDFDNIKLALSSTFEYGQNSSQHGAQRRNLKAFDLGWSMSYFGFTVGSSYGNWGKSLTAKNGIYSIASNKANAKYQTWGLAYQIGGVKTSLTSLTSNFYGNKYAALSFGLDYKIKKNLLSYIEITNFKFNSASSNIFSNPQQIMVANSSDYVQNNRGKVLITGIYYIF